MFNTRLEALSALCGSATTPGTGNIALSSYALVAKQLQDAQAVAAHQQQAAATQEAARITYWATAGLRNQPVAPSNPSRATLDYSACLGGQHNVPAFSGLSPNHPNSDAGAIALNIFMAHQQQHQQNSNSIASIALDRTPAAQQYTTSYCAAPVTGTVLSSPAEQYSAVTSSSASSSSSHIPAPMPMAMPTKSKKIVYKAPSGGVSSKSKPPPKKRHSRATRQVDVDTSSKSAVSSEWESKKQAKRASNRLSAHLSRKRKKMFLEDLKVENQDLRRKAQILQSVPDLIVVFDASGTMPFVSDSITRFLDFTSDELRDTSLWDRLTQESVCLVKNAFMDSLAVKRSEGVDSALLWNGESRKVKLVDRNEEIELLSLKGVVHFGEATPECVCSIRREDCTREFLSSKKKKRKVFSTPPSSLTEELTAPSRPDAAAAVSPFNDYQ